MPDTAIMTDSNCGLQPGEGEKYGIHIIPMPVVIDDNIYYEGVDITPSMFYEKQSQGASITSSQPSPGSVMEMWDRLLLQYKEIVYIPMSSGLSHSCESAMTFAGEEKYRGRVHVVDNHRISVTLTHAVFDAAILAGEGKNGAQIKEILEQEAMDATIYIAVDTLEYLRKGGRVTAAGAAIGTVLNIKPVLTIQGDKLDAFAKVRGMKAAFRTMCKALHQDMETRFKHLREKGELQLGIANTFMEPEEIERWKMQLIKEFPDMELTHIPLTLSIGCHTGPGALGIGAVRKHTGEFVV